MDETLDALSVEGSNNLEKLSPLSEAGYGEQAAATTGSAGDSASLVSASHDAVRILEAPPILQSPSSAN